MQFTTDRGNRDRLDIDDVPLCKACYDELPAAPGERSGE